MRGIKPLLTILSAFYLTQFVYWYITQPTHPDPMLKPAYEFSIIAMKGDKPVELCYQSSHDVAQTLKYFDNAYKNGDIVKNPAIKKEVQAEVDMPIVWADTGQALGQYRYYLTEADLPRINTQLDHKLGEKYIDYTVKILKDDPVRKKQTIYVDIHVFGNFYGFYTVENNRIVPPFNWIHVTEQYSIIKLPIFGVALIVSLVFWHYLIKHILKTRTYKHSDTQVGPFM